MLLEILGFIYIASLVCGFALFLLTASHCLRYYKIKGGMLDVMLAYTKLLVSCLVPGLGTLIAISLLIVFDEFNENMFAVVNALFFD